MIQECCGRKLDTPFCPLCGHRCIEPSDPAALLIYLKSQRSKTQAWVVRCQRHNACLSKEESDRRQAKHLASVARWDAWIRWVEERIGSPKP